MKKQQILIRSIAFSGLLAILIGCVHPNGRVAQENHRADSSQAAAKKIRIIDTHLHAYDCRDEGLDDLVKWMDKNGVAHGIVHPLKASRATNALERTQRVAGYRKHNGRVSHFCILTHEEVHTVEEAVSRLKKEKKDGAIGFGEHYGAGLFFDDPANMRLYEACAFVGLPVMFHMDGGRNKDEAGLPHLESALSAYPNCVFIAHGPLWWKRFSSGDCERLLEKYPNLYADISAGSGARALGRDLQVTRAFMTRFKKRILFGTDCGWWTFGKEKGAAPQFGLMESLSLPESVKHDIFHGNAEALFGGPVQDAAQR